MERKVRKGKKKQEEQINQSGKYEREENVTIDFGIKHIYTSGITTKSKKERKIKTSNSDPISVRR